MYSLYLWMCISNAPLNGLLRKGASHKPMRFDSYIREIVLKISNPVGLPNTPPWVKPLTGA